MSSLKLTYRTKVRPDDVTAVRQMVQDTGFFYPEEVDVAVGLVEEHLAHGTISGYYFIFADMDNRPVGYVCHGPTPCTVGSFDLYWIVVDKEYQGQGLGQTLLGLTEEAIRSQNGKRIYLETSGRDLYQPTVAFYEKKGYFQAAVLVDFYNIGDNKIIFQKNVE